jgi:DNA (cytosine-5)-methyltransferase 1
MHEAGMTAWRKRNDRRGKKAEITTRESIINLTPKDVVSQAFEGRKPKLFGIVGDPPCPDFSNGGNHSGHNGENGRLSKTFVKMKNSRTAERRQVT